MYEGTMHAALVLNLLFLGIFAKSCLAISCYECTSTNALNSGCSKTGFKASSATTKNGCNSCMTTVQQMSTMGVVSMTQVVLSCNTDTTCTEVHNDVAGVKQDIYCCSANLCNGSPTTSAAASSTWLIVVVLSLMATLLTTLAVRV